VPPPDGDAVHELTFAVWDLPSPVVTGRPLALKVGAKCSHGCDLTGATVEIRNDAGTLVGSGTVGPTPWTGTSALYWTDAQLIGPDAAGPACLTAGIAAVEDHLHPIASSTFRFVAVNPPEASPGASVIRAARLPLKSASMRGMVLGPGLPAAWIQDGVLAVLPGLRVVGEGPAPDLPTLEVLAEASGAWVGRRR